MDFGGRGTAPAVRITLRGPGGAAVTAQVFAGLAGDPVCRVVSSFFLRSEPPHSGDEYLLKVALPGRVPLNWLSVRVDGHARPIRLIRVCPETHCYREQKGMPPLYAPGTPYSVSLTLPVSAR